MTGTPEAYHSALSNHNPSLPLCANLTFSLTLTFMVLNSLLFFFFFFSLLFFLVDYERMVALMVKNLPANAEDKRNVDLIPGLGRRTFSVPWRRARQPTPVFLPGEFHGQRSLVGYGPQGCKESDTTEVT